MKLFLAIIASVLFPASYWICCSVYPNAVVPITNQNFSNDDLNKFTDLRFSGYAIFCAICFLNAGIEFRDNSESYKKLTKWFLDIGIGLTISDIIDRFYFNITKFEASDKVMIILTIVSATYFVYINNIIFKKKKI